VVPIERSRRLERVACYDGYAACPFTTARGKMLLAEFDYGLAPRLAMDYM
jgi:sulfide:quinone oxidoreductase